MEWASHRDLEKENSARTATKEAAKAATAAATAAQTMAGWLALRRPCRRVGTPGPCPLPRSSRSKILRKFEYTEGTVDLRLRSR